MERYIYLQTDALKQDEPSFYWHIGGYWKIIDKTTKQALPTDGGLIRGKSLEERIKQIVQKVEEHTGKEEKIHYIVGTPYPEKESDRYKGDLEKLKDSKQAYKQSFPEDKETLKLYEMSEEYLKKREEQILDFIEKYRTK